MNIIGPVFAALTTLPAAAWALCGAFAAGCLAGSFLNVVVHRVPRGETVVFGRSRCPACGATIRARDNVPVLGWLLLRGRCRDCGAAISARYPLIEAACGLLAATLAAIELLVPGSDPQSAAVAWGGRFALVLVIVAWSQLAVGAHVVSAPTVGVAAATAALTSALIPALHPLAAGCPPGGGAEPAGWLACLVASAAGVAAGWVAGSPGGAAARAACIVVGAALGWQAAVLAAVATAAGRRSPAFVALAVVAAICWRPIAWAWNALCGCGAGG